MQRPTPRILYSFPHPLGGPGINNTAWQQINAIAALGAEVTVYCTSLRQPLPPNVSVVETLVVHRRRIPHRAIGLQRAYSYHDLRVALVLRANGGRFDVVHAWPRACLRTVAAARAAGVASLRELPNAHTAQTFRDAATAGQAVGVELPRGASHRFDRRRLQMEEAEFAASDFLLAPSEYVAVSFLRAGITASKLLRHRYGFDPALFPTPDLRSSDRTFTAVFVGRGEPAKGLHIALEAWRQSGLGQQGKFLIVGSLLESYRARLGGMLSLPGVQLCGFVDDVGTLMRQADVLLLPSFTEGSALVTYEAMASGAVPLVSTASGAPALDGVDGLFHEVGDVLTLATQLRDLNENRESLALLRQAALARRDELTWKASGEVLLRQYAYAATQVRTRHPQ